MQIPTYQSIGVRPLINCRGTYTIISGSLMLPEVREAMAEASKSYVHLEELMEAVGARIAELMQCEWALVTNGCAAALSQLTAACIAGKNPDHIKQLPNTTGLKNRVLYQPGHLHIYTHAIRATGAQLIEVEDHDALALALDDQTAMFAFFGDRADNSNMPLEDVVTICHRKNVPVLVDAAAERPDSPNVYLEAGADMVAYSGGKCLRGPQSAGLVLGRKDLLQAAFANGAPHHSIGRAMKAGKEEIMGLLAAVEKWVERDHDAEWREWENRLDIITNAVSNLPSITTRIQQPGRSNVCPILEIHWEPKALPITPDEVQHQLSDGDPRIEVFTHENGIEIMPYMMQDGEDVIVAKRLKEILGK
ncbi:MAG: aminotransferase class V-fold PLP-dependent enzyme [Candidatus Latescibacteria bacterium]|nr:aminotransferase class V-fold PLP-dependent enzyme [Candidatus Latescibacterota bacterium]